MTTEKRNVPEEPADKNMTEEEKTDMIDQVEEFEGPQRREIRGDDSEPPNDPGVSHS